MVFLQLGKKIFFGEMELHDRYQLDQLVHGGSLVVTVAYRGWSDEEIEQAAKKVMAALRGCSGSNVLPFEREQTIVAILANMGCDDIRVALVAVHQNARALKYLPPGDEG